MRIGYDSKYIIAFDIIFDSYKYYNISVKNKNL